MLKVEKGGEYTAYRVRSGEASRGPWELIVIKEEGGAHRELTVFARNTPSGVEEGGRFRVVEITSAGSRRSKKSDGSWTMSEKTSIEAIVEPTASAVDLAPDLTAGWGDDDLEL